MIPEIDGFIDLAEIDRGGFSTVYQAHETRLDRLVAVKVLDAKELSDDQMRRFERECKAMGSLSYCPQVVTVYAPGTTREGHPYLSMELAASSLKHDLSSVEGSALRAAKIGVEMALALVEAHSRDILHRDIKPGNVLMFPGGASKLTDFGISSYPDDHVTAAGDVFFTTAFAPPEVLRRERATKQSDIYSLAATLASVVLGRAVFSRADDESDDDFLDRVKTDDPPDLEAHGASPALAAVIMRGMSKSAADRYSTASCFLDDLMEVPEAPARPLPPKPTTADDATEGGQPVEAAAAVAVAATEASPTEIRDANADAAPTSSPSGDPTRRRRGGHVVAWIAAVAAVPLIGGALLVLYLLTSPTPVPVVKPTIDVDCYGLACNFAATPALEARDKISWTFGDGAEEPTELASTLRTSHRYATPGGYIATVKVSRPGTDPVSSSAEVRIDELDPTVSLTVSLGTGVHLVVVTSGPPRCAGGSYELQRRVGAGWDTVLRGAATARFMLGPEGPADYRAMLDEHDVEVGVCEAATSEVVTIRRPTPTPTPTPVPTPVPTPTPSLSPPIRPVGTRPGPVPPPVRIYTPTAPRPTLVIYSPSPPAGGTG